MHYHYVASNYGIRLYIYSSQEYGNYLSNSYTMMSQTRLTEPPQTLLLINFYYAARVYFHTL